MSGLRRRVQDGTVLPPIDKTPGRTVPKPAKKRKPQPGADWMDFGLCRSKGELTPMFYADGSTSETILQIERAKQLCGQCAVREACLDYALKRREGHGVWGGLDERERRSILRRRAQLARAALKSGA